MVDDFCVEEHHWAAKKLDLEQTKYLCDELEWRLQARPSCPTLVHDLTKLLWKA